MSQDILADARNRILAEQREQLPKAPDSLVDTYEKHGGFAGMAAGAATGAYFGAGLGIAGGPLGACAGTIPGAIIGGIIGYFGGAKAGKEPVAASGGAF